MMVSRKRCSAPADRNFSIGENPSLPVWPRKVYRVRISPGLRLSFFSGAAFQTTSCSIFAAQASSRIRSLLEQQVRADARGSPPPRS